MHGPIEIPSRDQVVARDLGGIAKASLIAGLVGIGVSVLLGMSDMTRFGHSMLVALMFFLSIGLGALFFVLLQHVTSAGWSVVVRRVAEMLTGIFPMMALVVVGLIAIPALMGKAWIYDWLSHDWVHAEGEYAGGEYRGLIAGKESYLNATFLVVRLAVYFVIFIGLSRFFGGNSLAQDDDQDPARTVKMQRRSGISIILFGLATTFCSFDLLMSLNAEWFSTMYGVYFFAGCFWSSLATLALATMWLEKRGQLKDVVNEEHYHDIGKLMFAFTFFWSYVAFSQLMLYWYADISEETMWFNYRIWGEWNGFSILLLVGHFLIPMLGLLSRHVKRRRNVLAAWCVYVLLFHYVDLYWNVMPELVNGLPGLDPAEVGPAFGLIDITSVLGIGGLFLYGFLSKLDGKPALAIGDPRLAESMAFENI